MSQTENDAMTNGHAENGQAHAPPREAPVIGDDGSSELSFDGPGAAQLVKTLAAHDLPKDVVRLVESELNQDHILANLDNNDIHRRMFDLRNQLELILASFPSEESALQGEIRKEFGFRDAKKALTPEQLHDLRQAFYAAYDRTTRSRNGWQQHLLAEQTQEVRHVEDPNKNSGGIISRILG